MCRQGYAILFVKTAPKLWPSNWFLQINNAPAYNALTIRFFLAKKQIAKLNYLPYSPDLAPRAFLAFFQKLKVQ